MLVERAAADHPRRAAERRVGAAARARRDLGALRRGDDRYLRERKGDVADVVGRLCMNLRAGGDPADLVPRTSRGRWCWSPTSSRPSVIAQLDWQRLAAFVTDAGSWTYHTAILARSIHVPAVAGLHNASGADRAGRARRGGRHDRRGARRSGRRDAARRSTRRQRQRRRLRAVARRVPRRCRRSPRTASTIRLEANIELPEDAARARRARRRRASACSDRSSCSPAAGRRR